MRRHTNQAAEGLSISWDDLNRGIYLIGMPGVGKSTIIINLGVGLAKANLTGRFPNAFVMFDVKGDESLRLLKRLPVLDPEKVTFLDPDMTGFVINPLALPPHAEEDTEKVRALHIDFLMSWLKEQFGSTSENTPQMLRIFRAILTAYYRLTNSPTFADLYYTAAMCQTDPATAIRELTKAFGELPEEQLTKMELEQITKIDPKSFNPLLNRLAAFVIIERLFRHFCVRLSTWLPRKSLEKGMTTIIRLSKRDLGEDEATWFEAAIVLALWFAIMERAKEVPEEKRTQVVVAIDEFQNVQKLEAIHTILAEARSAKTGLILSHQNSSQIDEETFDDITGTCSVQAAGRVNGKDAARLAHSWDPQFAEGIKRTLTTQPDFSWTFRLRAGPGEEQPPPIQRVILDQSPVKHTDDEVQKFIEEMKREYGVPAGSKPFLLEKKEREAVWRRFWPEDLKIPSKEAYPLLVALLRLNPNPESGAAFTRICEEAGAPRSGPAGEKTQALVDELNDEKLVSRSHISPKGVRYYTLTIKGRLLVDPDVSMAAESKDGQEIARFAMRYYQERGVFVYPALQKYNEQRPDLIAYDYDKEAPASVEIESSEEVRAHMEQVKQNTLKFMGMGFPSLHVWCHRSDKEKVEAAKPETMANKIEVFCPEDFIPRT